ncbi:unnamed protein product [Malus baccata var. baccata]
MDNPAFVAAPSQEVIVVAQVPGELSSTISKACRDSQVLIDMVDLEILSNPTDAGSVSSAFTLAFSVTQDEIGTR